MIGRVLILLAVALGVGMYFPESRAAILDRADPALEPGRRWVTGRELRQIATEFVVFAEGRGEAVLRRGEFDGWLDRRFQDESTRTDSWGTRYTGELARSVVRVISAGPDLRFGTADDLSWEEPRI